MTPKITRLVVLVAALRHASSGTVDLHALASEIGERKIDTQLSRMVWHLGDKHKGLSVDSVMGLVDRHLNGEFAREKANPNFVPEIRS